MSFLAGILRHKKKETAALKKSLPEAFVKKAALSLPRKKRAFEKALRSARPFALIAEIKRRSPSAGILRKDFDPGRIARQYGANGAAALSVLTDRKYFGGSPSFIAKAKRAAGLPVLRKDFILEDYQVYESRLLNADAILLIARALSPVRLRTLYRTATKLGLDTLFEVHNAAELKKILPLKPRLVGVNNRDLGTFKTDLNVSRRLSGLVPKKALFVSESGIRDGADLRLVRSWGARAALVGESLMREKDPGRALKRLLGGARASR